VSAVEEADDGEYVGKICEDHRPETRALNSVVDAR